MKNSIRLVYNREEMLQLNIQTLRSRGVEVDEIAQIAYQQQSKYHKDIPFQLCWNQLKRF